MNVIDISNEIQKKILEIDSIRKEIKSRGEVKADTLTQYEKMIAVTLMKLENGVEFELNGEKIVNPPKSIMDKIARGICNKEKYAMELAETGYKSVLVNLEACMAQTNALQSLNRYLDKA
jgi:hypothetical protein